ncbi:MAG: FAD-dependent oxidoreductase [Limisphaerales bacterium]
MNRRKFLGLAGVATSYSLLVNVDDLPATVTSIPLNADPFNTVAPPSARPGKYRLEPTMTLVDLRCDVFVAGGGMAGVCAAISAARNGAKVVLVQDRSRLGGNASSEVKMHIVGANQARPGWRESGLIEELRLEDAVRNPHRSWELWDFLLYDKIKSEPNITLLLDTVLFKAEKKRNAIEQVLARCDKTEHIYRITADIYLDCTGDCRLALEAGADMRWGRESRSEFNESLAPESADAKTLGSSILFTARDYGKPIPFKAPAWARKVTKEHLRFRTVRSWEYGYWWIEWGGKLNTIRDNERIRAELLSIVMGVWDYIKNSGEHPTSANWAMDWVGMVPGKRESRRIIGDHMLTQHDLLGLTEDFEDAVAIGGWPLDDHPPGGFDDYELRPYVQVKTPEVYNIPLRSLYSRNIKNLMMAGRNISATHAAFCSTRVMATCSVMGQAAGTAAALCSKDKLTPRELYGNKSKLNELQQVLLRDDQAIKNRRSIDPKDLARTANITASSSVEPTKPENIINGITRNPAKKLDNCWAAKLTQEGAWIELTWDKPQTLSQLQITFDSGFDRELTLTSQDSFNKRMIRGVQPETVKKYKLLYRTGDGQWKELASVEDNFQRVNRYRFQALQTNAVRLVISETNGDDLARVFEVRCYA